MEKIPGIMVVGDSNLRHLAGKVYRDRKLSRLPLHVDRVSGRKVADITYRDIERFAAYRYVILMVGNNDLGQFRDRSATDSIIVACNLVAVAELLQEKGCRVRVVKMLPRTDVSADLIDECNVVLKRHLGRNLFSKMTIYHCKFANRGGFHPIESGQLDLLRGLYKACRTFGFK